MGVLAAALLTSSVLSIDRAYSLKTLTRQHLFFLLLLPAIAALFADPIRQRWALVGLAAAGLVSAIPGIILYYHGVALHEAGWIEKISDYVWRASDDLGNPYQRARGMLESYTRSALVQVFALPALVVLAVRALANRKWVVLALAMASAGVCAFFLLLTKSRGAWVAAGMAMAFAFVAARGGWRWLFAVGVVGGLALMAMPQERARALTMIRQVGQPDLLLSGRIDLWKQGIEPIRSSPWVGIGYGANIFLRPAARERGFALMTDRAQPDLHQMYLQTIAEVGVVGLLAYSLVVGWILLGAMRVARGGRSPESAGAALAAGAIVVTLLIVGVIYTFNEDRIGQLFWTALGLMLAGERSLRAPSESAPPQDP
jgi:O-antigen ligase